MSDAFSDTQQRFAHRIKDGRVCHTLLPTLNKFEKVSNSPTQRSELKTNPNILDLFWNRIPNICHVPMSLKETVAVEQSLTSGLKVPQFSHLVGGGLDSFPSRAEASAHGRSSYLPVAEVLFKGLWQCGFVPQLQMLPSSPWRGDSSSVETACSATRDLSLFKPHLKSSSSTTPSRRPPYSSSSAQRGPARQFSWQSSSQQSSSPFRL